MKVKPKTKPKPVKPVILHPLYLVERGDTENKYWIISKDEASALLKACEIWRRQRLSVAQLVTVKRQGTVDYIPALKKPHWEAL